MGTGGAEGYQGGLIQSVVEDRVGYEKNARWIGPSIPLQGFGPYKVVWTVPKCEGAVHIIVHVGCSPYREDTHFRRRPCTETGLKPDGNKSSCSQNAFVHDVKSIWWMGVHSLFLTYTSNVGRIQPWKNLDKEEVNTSLETCQLRSSSQTLDILVH